MIPLTFLYDEYIDRPKFTEQKKNPFEYIVPSPTSGVGTMKEQTCRVSQTVNSEMEMFSEAFQASFTLPDGTNLMLGTEQYESTEVLFENNSKVTKNQQVNALQTLVHDSISKSSNSWYDGVSLNEIEIFLAGGNTKFEGFMERLQFELLQHNTSSEKKIKLIADKTLPLDYQTWIGGSILASMDNLIENFVSVPEYQEWGAKIARIKCF